MIQNVGEHRVKHGDIMNGIDDLMGGEKADIFYSDPPWGDGNLKFWDTLNKKQNKIDYDKKRDIESFYSSFFDSVQRYAKNIVFIEQGLRWKEFLIGKAKDYGLHYLGTIEAKYKGGGKLLPCHTHIFAKQPVSLPQGYIQNLMPLQDAELVRETIKPFVVPGGIVLDPCCGMGFTAMAAMSHGMKFRGNELSLHRLNKCITKLERG